MRFLLSVVAVVVTACATEAQPARKRPPDLVAAPPLVSTPIYIPLWHVPYWGGFYANPVYSAEFLRPPVVILAEPPPVPVTPVNPTRLAEDADRAAASAPATLTLELPATADVWLDGNKQPSSTATTRTLHSAPLNLGAEYTFRIRARWVENGTTYEATPTSTVRAGERGRLTVYSGTMVK